MFHSLLLPFFVPFSVSMHFSTKQGCKLLLYPSPPHCHPQCPPPPPTPHPFSLQKLWFMDTVLVSYLLSTMNQTAKWRRISLVVPASCQVYYESSTPHPTTTPTAWDLLSLPCPSTERSRRLPRQMHRHVSSCLCSWLLYVSLTTS